jgi:hypothetical protein
MSEEIALRQKEISSDWPLLIIPSHTDSKEDKDLYDKSIIQAQISNASQMAIRMLLKKDLLAAIRSLMDIYALSTRAATLLNNERIEIRLPGAKNLLDFEQGDVVRPAAKEALSSYKSFTTMQSFFRDGGTFSPTKPDPNPKQELQPISGRSLRHPPCSTNCTIRHTTPPTTTGPVQQVSIYVCSNPTRRTKEKVQNELKLQGKETLRLQREKRVLQQEVESLQIGGRQRSSRKDGRGLVGERNL